MKKNEPITKVMSSALQTIHDGEPVSKLRVIFENAKIHHIPVVSGNKLIGIVSWNDFMRISFGTFGEQNDRGVDEVLDHTYKIHDVLTSDLVTLPLSATVRDAARILGEGKFHALPILDGENLVGIVTSSDLIRYLAEQ